MRKAKCRLTVLLVMFASVFCRADNTSITLTSGQTYFKEQTEIDYAYESVTVKFTGRGVLSFDFYLAYGVGLEAAENGNSLLEFYQEGQWATKRIYFDSATSHEIRFYGISDSYYQSGVGYLRNVKWGLNETLPEEELYTWVANTDGTVSINGHKSTVSGSVVLPSSLEGKTVTGLKGSALRDCASITSIHIPASITNIESGLSLPCRFTSLTVASDNKVFHVTSNILIDYQGTAVVAAYPNFLTAASQWTLPSELKQIGPAAFYSRVPTCKSIVIPEGVSNICESAFAGCWGVGSIKLPSTLVHIGSDAFFAVDSDDDNTWSYSIPVDVPTLTSLAAVDSDWEYGWRSSPLFGGHEDYYDSDIYCYTSGVRVAMPVEDVLPVENGVQKIGHYSLANAAPAFRIPASVKSVSSSLFLGRGEYHFEGAAPEFKTVNCGYHGSIGGTIYVTSSAGGWGTVPGVWNGVSVLYDGEVPFEVKLDANGGQCPSSVKSVVNGKAYGDLPEATRVGYEFAGWFTDRVGGYKVKTTDIAGCHSTLFAHWRAIAYPIEYSETNGVENPNPTTYTIEDEIEFLPLEDIEGFAFGGWCPSKLEPGTTGTVNVVARWRLADGGPYVEEANGIYWSFIIANGTAVVGEGKMNLRAIDPSTAGRVVVPSELGGAKVVGIAKYAFRDCYNITSIVVPEGVETIGTQAFYDCYSLTAVEIPGSVTNVGPMAFSQCYYLDEVGVAACASVTNVFASCDCAISIVRIASGAKAISSNVLAGCTSVSKVVLPATLEEVGDYAFSDCVSLCEIRFNGNAPTCQEHAFDNIPDDVTFTTPDTTVGWNVEEGKWHLHQLIVVKDLAALFESANFAVPDMVYGDEDYKKLEEHDFYSLSNWSESEHLAGLRFGEDFDFYAYNEDSGSASVRSAGRYYLVFSGLGEYEGEFSCDFVVSRRNLVELFEQACFEIPDMVVGDENYNRLQSGGSGLLELNNWTDDEHLCGLFGRGSYDISDYEDFRCEVTRIDEGSEDYYYWPAGKYRVTYEGVRNYCGEISYDFTISKASYWMSGYGPSLNDDYYNTTYEGVLHSDSEVFLRGYVMGYSNYSYPSYSVNCSFPWGYYYGYDYYYDSPYSVYDESTIWNNGEYKWVFDFHHAGYYNIDVYVPYSYWQDDWTEYSIDSWSGSYQVAINPAGMEDYVSVAFPSDVLQYNGKEHEISNSMFVVTIDGVEVEQDEYFHLGFEGSYWDFWQENIVAATNVGVKAGTYRVLVFGLGDYAGSQYVDVVVNPCSITNCTVRLNPLERVYDGSPQTVEVTVVDDKLGVELEKGVDYRVAYSDNVLPGIATVKIEGLGNYKDTLDSSFRIESAEFELEKLPGMDLPGFEGYYGEYDGKGHQITPRVLSPLKYEASYAMQSGGPYAKTRPLTDVCDVIQWCRLEAVGYNSRTGFAKVVITRRDIVKADVTAQNVLRGALDAPELQVSVVDVGTIGTLALGRDYEVETVNDLEGGSTTVNVIGKGNYCGTNTVTIAYPIKRATVGGVVWHYMDRGQYAEICYFASDAHDALSGMVKVPDAIDDKPVTHIGPGAFFACASVTGLSFGTNVCSIGSAAFAGCSNLSDLVFDGELPVETEDAFGDDSVRPRVWTAVPTNDETYFGREIIKSPAISANPSTGVQSGRISIKLSCDLIEGVTLVRYTKDGSEPNAESPVYEQKFSVTVNGVTTVKAAVFVQGVRVGRAYTFQYAQTLTELFDANDLLTLATSAPITYDTGNRSWQIDETNSGGDATPCMRSSENIKDEDESWLSATFTGAGIFEFKWTSSCEWDDEAGDDEPIFDHGYCTLDGEVVAWIDGETEWKNVVLEVASDGEHEIRWVYYKDESDDDNYMYENCIRVDCVKFTYPTFVSFEAGEAMGAVPETIVSAPGYRFVLPFPDGLSLSKHTFAGWKTGGVVYAAGAEIVAAPTDMVFEAVWVEKHLTAPVISVAERYDEESTTVSLESAEQVTMFYTIDGTQPSSASSKYIGPFTVTGSATIKAVAVDEDWFDSPVAEAVTQRSWLTLEDCLGANGFQLSTGGDRNWIGDVSEACVKSVRLSAGEVSWLMAKFRGAGVAEWLYRSPTNGWIQINQVFDDDGEHELRWEGGELWVKSLKFTPAAYATFVSAEPVTGSLPSRICSAPGYEIRLPSFDGFCREKYTFDGWTDGALTYHPDDVYVITGDVEFVVNWSPNLIQTPEIKVEPWYDVKTTVVKISVWGPHGTIYYTLDGSEPTRESNVYTGEFSVEGSCTIKAFSVKENYFDSEVVEATTVRAPWTTGEILNAPTLVFETDGVAWTRDFDVSHDGVAALRSGKIGNRGLTRVTTTVEGEGVLSFWYKTSCEAEAGAVYDGLRFYVDGIGTPGDNKDPIGGEIGWTYYSLPVVGSGPHTLTWQYEKDRGDYADVGEDCIWIDEVKWIPGSEVVDLARVFGSDSEVVRQITGDVQVSAFVAFVKSCGVDDISKLSSAEKIWAYQSFKLSEITTAPRLFKEEPVLKIDDIELTGGNLSLTISLTAGAEAIQLAKDKLAEKIRVGSEVSAITQKPVIGSSETADNQSVVFTIVPPQGNKGFIRIIVE